MNWIKEISLELKTIKTDKKELVKFGLVVGGIFLILSFLLENYFMDFFTVGLALIISGLIFPRILRYLYVFWMSVAVVLSYFVFRLFLAVFYIFVIIPFGLLSRISRKDFLNKDFKKRLRSYWVKHSGTNNPEEPY